MADSVRKGIVAWIVKCRSTVWESSYTNPEYVTTVADADYTKAAAEGFKGFVGVHVYLEKCGPSRELIDLARAMLRYPKANITTS
jgi:hypothetical protein